MLRYIIIYKFVLIVFGNFALSNLNHCHEHHDIYEDSLCLDCQIDQLNVFIESNHKKDFSYNILSFFIFKEGVANKSISKNNLFSRAPPAL